MVQDDPSGVQVVSKRCQVACHIGYLVMWQAPSEVQDGPSGAQDGPNGIPVGSILWQNNVPTLLGVGGIKSLINRLVQGGTLARIWGQFGPPLFCYTPSLPSSQFAI